MDQVVCWAMLVLECGLHLGQRCIGALLSRSGVRLRMVCGELRRCRDSVKERGAGNVVELDARVVPPESEQETRGDGPGAGRRVENEHEPVPMEVVDEAGPVSDVPGMNATAGEGESDGSQSSGARVSDVNGHGPGGMTVSVDGPGVAVENEDTTMEAVENQSHERQASGMSEPEPQSVVDNAIDGDGGVAVSGSAPAESSAYAPVRTQTALSRAMRRNVHLLDMGRPARVKPTKAGDEQHEVLLHEDVLVAELKKKRKKEVSEASLLKENREGLIRAKVKEWDKIVKSSAIKVHSGKAAEQIIAECGEGRMLQSRFVVTYPDDEEQVQQGIVKARWCVRGYPDLLDLRTASPTLSQEGFAITLQMLASNRWGMKIGDVEGAFLKGDPLQRENGRVLVRLPGTVVPGVPDGSIVELLKPVYGLADAPKAWFDTLTTTLRHLGCVQSALDACVFYYRKGSGTQGIMAIQVDDILFGGSEQFITAIMEPLKAKFPFKHWKVGEGEFLGKKLVQQESGEIRVCQQDYANMVECIPLTKERERERQ